MAKRKRRKKTGCGIGIIIIILIIALGGYLGLSALKTSISKPFDSENTSLIAIHIPSGSSTSKVANILEDAGIIASAKGYKLYTKLEGYDGNLKAGDYNLSPSMSAEEISNELLIGKSNTARFTIPEGFSTEQTAKKLSEDGFVDYEDFMNEIQNGSFDYKFVEYLPQGQNRFEGFLFPETYEVYVSASTHDVIDKMLSQFDKVFKDEYYARATELGYSFTDIITIASIIEREAQVSQDRALISSVIYNRMNIDMPLQMCSTVQYILGDPKAVLTTQDTKIESPYNTYLNKGLPPGPICSPGADSIYAALYPADTNYIYFVVSEKLDGSHAFSADYNQFLRDKDSYQKALRKK